MNCQFPDPRKIRQKILGDEKDVEITGANDHIRVVASAASKGAWDSFTSELPALLDFLQKSAAEAGVEIECFQSNHEGAIVDAIQAAYGAFDGIVINPAAYTHTSVAILDALKAVALPAVEVHLSDVSAREEFRHISYAGMACRKTFMGLGFEGYRQAILFLRDEAESR